MEGQVQGAAPRCGRGRGAGGEPLPSHWPHVQAASYLRYHITSSSPSSAGSINGCGCFPQGMSTVGKPRRGGSGLYSSPVLGVLETNGARRVPAASGAAANPGTGCRVSPAAGSSPHPNTHPQAQAGLWGMPLSAPRYPWPGAAIPDEPHSLCPKVPGRATPAQRWFSNHDCDLAWCGGSPPRDHHTRRDLCTSERAA